LVAEITTVCPEGLQRLTSVIEPMAARRAALLRRGGLALRPDAEPFDFCLTCGPSNDRTGVIVCAVLVAVAIGLYPLLALARRRPSLMKPVAVGPRLSVEAQTRMFGGFMILAGGLLILFGQNRFRTRLESQSTVSQQEPHEGHALGAGSDRRETVQAARLRADAKTKEPARLLPADLGVKPRSRFRELAATERADPRSSQTT
jgi:hypothetical protein